MAKSGMYLNGKELREDELDKLNEIERLRCQLETHIRIEGEFARTMAEAFKNKDKKDK